MRAWMLIGGIATAWATSTLGGELPHTGPAIEIQLNVEIPLRDGVRLNATLYRPKESPPSPCLTLLTPYVADTYHGAGVHFAQQGFPFLLVDVRGRGNSGGVFRANIQEINDAYDVVEWLARQPYCNGKVGMGGGSYSGYNQWAAAKNRPPHLVTIVPRAASYPGLDFPGRNNLGSNYVLQWFAAVNGRTLQENLLGDKAFWSQLFYERFLAGKPFNSLDRALGGEDLRLHEWLQHPEQSAYWDAFVPTPDDYRHMTLPVLTITGAYDDDQPGALAYYRNAMRYGSNAFKAANYLIIGPWDHSGTGTPRDSVGGVKFGPASLVDLTKLNTDWYRWTMAGGPQPAFLKNHVAYYVTGADKWRYADTLDAVTSQSVPYYLNSKDGPLRLATPGSLNAAPADRDGADRYVYDPRDVSTGELERDIDPTDPGDSSVIRANDGKQLVYETDAFGRAAEVSGFFRVDAWLSIDRPDTDFRAAVYLVKTDGRMILLATDVCRARYRQSLRRAVLINSTDALPYHFDRFTFSATLVQAGEKLRLVMGPINSIYAEKNYNSGKPVSSERLKDAEVVNVKLLHGPEHPSIFYIPFAR